MFCVTYGERAYLMKTLENGTPSLIETLRRVGYYIGTILKHLNVLFLELFISHFNELTMASKAMAWIKSMYSTIAEYFWFVIMPL